uniref:Thioredoxin domain-containing protein n=1 Tax=Panagrellus redivivus TaxID=6233 RepID=A0A7E4VLU1_PANRE
MSSPRILFAVICSTCVLLVAGANTTELTTTDEPCNRNSSQECGSTDTLETSTIEAPTTLDSVLLPSYAEVLSRSLFPCTQPHPFNPPPLVDFISDETPPDEIPHVLATKNIVVIVPQARDPYFNERFQSIMETMRCYFENVPFIFVSVETPAQACDFLNVFSDRESKAIYPVVAMVPGDSTDPFPPCRKFNKKATVVQIVVDDSVNEGAAIMIWSKTVEFFAEHSDLSTSRTGFDLLAVAMNPFLRISEYEFHYGQLDPEKRATEVTKPPTWQTSIIVATMIGFAGFIFAISAILVYGIHRENREAKKELNIRKGLAEHEELSGDVAFTKNEF